MPTDSSSESPEPTAPVNTSPTGSADAAAAPSSDGSAKSPARAGGPQAMMAIPATELVPTPLADKHFEGEMQCDFDTALGMVRAADRRVEHGLLASLMNRFGLGGVRDGAMRQDRHVAFDGFSNPLHDEKIERDRRYGTVYTVFEHANAYLVSLEMPRRVPASSLKELWHLPDEMPDYDYSITIHGNVLAVRAGVRGPALRRLSYISASFPSDFLTRIEFGQPVAAFKHRLRDKVLEIVVFKAGAEASKAA